MFSQTDPCVFTKRPPVIILSKTLPESNGNRTRFWYAGGKLLLAELTPWMVDEYIRDVDYTKISLHTLGHNIRLKNWEWDSDGFTTNQFGHPYHGSFYFNAFRTTGYNFWQSSLATVAGSYIWETAAENQPPSPNDLINTSFGGIVLGEMLYRLSNRVTTSRMNGRNKQVSNIAALLINPLNVLSRVSGGKNKAVSYKGPADTTPVITELDFGLRMFKANGVDNNFILHGRARLMYGSVYENYKTPFSNILINVEFGNDDSSKINIASIYGSLKGWPLKQHGSSKQMAMLTANYDFIHNEAFFYSAQSIRFNLHSRFGAASKTKVNTVVGAGIILLSAVPDGYADKGRRYDYCTGAGLNGSLNVAFADRIFGVVSYRGGWLKTIDGNASHYFIHTVNAELGCRVLERFSVCAEPGYFSLKGNYKHYPGIGKTYPYFRLSVRYSGSGK